MASSNHIHNIAIIGGTGQIGATILPALLDHPSKFAVTAVSRSDSTATFPSSVKVVKGDYSSPNFFESAFAGIDALIITLSHTAPKDLQRRMIDAAIKAGVGWIMPSDFGSDGAHPHVGGGIPVNAGKAQFREQVGQAGTKSKWLSLVNGPWYDFSFKVGAFGIDPLARRATLYSGGLVKFNTSTWKLVGASVAALLSLPVTSPSGPALENYANNYVYISSFHISQRDILTAAQAATGTTDADWTIEDGGDAKAWMDDGFEKFGKGDMSGMIPMIYGSHFVEGLGGSFEGKKEKLNDVVEGLPREDLVEVTRRLIGEMEAETKKGDV